MKPAPNVDSVIVGENYNNVYLITGERAAFFDSGFEHDESANALLELWESAGKPDVAAIVISHRHADHSGGARKLSEATGGVVISSPVEKPHIEAELSGTVVGRTAADGETLDLGGVTLEFIHTPGHTVGSLSAVYRERGVLFAGDTIRTSDPFKVDANAGDMAMHLESLRKLKGYGPQVIAPGHGPLVNDPDAHIEAELARLGS